MARPTDEDKRARILDAARVTFGESGYQQTTVKQIAVAAGIAPGTLYTYFENKEDLFFAAVDDIWNRFMSGMQNISLGTLSLFEKIVEFIDFGFKLLVEIHPLLRGMYSEANRRELLLERMDEICSFIAESFEEGYVDGMLLGPSTNEDVRMFNLRMIVSGIMFRTSLTPPESLPDELERIKRSIVLGLRERFSAGQSS